MRTSRAWWGCVPGPMAAGMSKHYGGVRIPKAAPAPDRTGRATQSNGREALYLRRRIQLSHIPSNLRENGQKRRGYFKKRTNTAIRVWVRPSDRAPSNALFLSPAIRYGIASARRTSPLRKRPVEAPTADCAQRSSRPCWVISSPISSSHQADRYRPTPLPPGLMSKHMDKMSNNNVAKFQVGQRHR